MGIPSYYRWLCKKYPRVPIDARGDEDVFMDGKPIPTDTSTPNPNEIEFDNLYLDMNGIIHPCCHPENGDAPPSEEDMFLKIHKYIDRIFSLVRPRKVLYMAIDGVAPRAKMNQQRQRRFRAAQERAEHSKLEDNLRELFNKTGKGHLLPPKKGAAWDSNVITPGTPFMANLSESLRFYIADRLQNDPGWKNIQVIFSDATVPGEGEHKILHFIRNQRSQPGYNPNTVHCLYGMDADLIMLSLASHEPHFYIIREIVFSRAEMVCTTCGRGGHHAGECEGLDKETVIRYADSSLDHYIAPEKLLELQTKSMNSVVTIRKKNTQPYQFLSISILREYLVHELSFPSQLFDLERAIDDWVFLCFFVGNDFLPHMPALEIRENAIGVMQKIWKSIILSQIKEYEQHVVNLYYNTLTPKQKMEIDKATLSSGTPEVKAKVPLSPEDKEAMCSKLYLTNDGDVNLKNLHAFLQKFQIFEAAILFSKNKKHADQERKQRRLQDAKDRDDAAARQINADNADLLKTTQVDVVAPKKPAFAKTRIKPQSINSESEIESEITTDLELEVTTTTTTTTSTTPAAAEDDEITILGSNKKRKTEETASGDSGDELVQLAPAEPAESLFLKSLLSDVDQNDLTKAETILLGVDPTVLAKQPDEEEESATVIKVTTPQQNVEGNDVDEEELPTPMPPLDGTKPPTTTRRGVPLDGIVEESTSASETTTTTEKNKTPKQTEASVEIDIATGKIKKKVGPDYHVVLPEQNPLKKKRGKDSKIKFGDEYSTINPHIAFQAAMHKLKERLAEAPTSEVRDASGKVTKTIQDTVKLGSQGYEHRYYQNKFHVDIEKDQSAFEHIHLSYITGLRWVFHYYYKGCPSWNWYYPYHYAPLISSLAKVDYNQYLFDVSSPLNPTDDAKETRDTHTIITTSLYSNAQPILPFEQLLSVFPAASAHALPPPLARLMVDPTSPIADFYPAEFGLDTVGKKFLWQGVVQLPFIDMERLKRSVAKCEHLLTADELERNRHGVNYIFSRFEADDVNNTNSTALMQVQLETEHKLRELKKKANTQPLKVWSHGTPSSETIQVKDLIEQYSNLKTLENALLAQRRSNPGVAAQYETDVLPKKTKLYRTIRGFFNQAVTQKPTGPVTLNQAPNADAKTNETLRALSPYIQWTHDISQWQYDYSSVVKQPGLIELMLSGICRIVEPSLAQHTTVFAKCVDEKTNLCYLQGNFGLMCEQLIPGQTIKPSAAYQTAKNDLQPIENAQVVSYIFITPPAGRHVHGLLPGATVGFKEQFGELENTGRRNDKYLNEKDLLEIGIHKQGFNEFTFEYLYGVIKNREVYNRKDSTSKDVQAFDELGLDQILQNMKAQPAVAVSPADANNTNNNKKKEKTIFDIVFGQQIAQLDATGGITNYNTGTFDKRTGVASFQSNQIPPVQHIAQTNYSVQGGAGAAQAAQLAQQQQMALFQQQFQNPNMQGYQPMQAPPQGYNPYGATAPPNAMMMMHPQQMALMQQQQQQQQMMMMQQQMAIMNGGQMMMTPQQQQQMMMMQQQQQQQQMMMMQQQQQQYPMMMQQGYLPPGMAPPPQYNPAAAVPQQGYPPQPPPPQQRFTFQHPNLGKK